MEHRAPQVFETMTTPDLAIDEAKRIRETVEASVSGEQRAKDTPVGGVEV